VVSLFAQGPWQLMMPMQAESPAHVFDWVQQLDVTQLAHDTAAYPIPQATAADASPLLPPSEVAPSSVPPSAVPHWLAQLELTQETNPSFALMHGWLPVSFAWHALEFQAESL
jgi:hypothetical protein